MSDSPVMAPTGERMVPTSAFANTFWEHVYRYHFAGGYVKGKIVLDIASGEGYGTAALAAAGAAGVIGVDIAPEAVEHARAKYRLDFRVGDGAAVPLDDASVDVVVSFETIEHVPDPTQFADECRRVLKPGGRVLMSTPLNETYGHDNANPFHVSEMGEGEFVTLMRERFSDVRLYAQRAFAIPSWRADIAAGDGPATRARKIARNFFARAAGRLGLTNRLYDTARWRDRPVEAIQSPAGRRLPLNPYRVRPRAAFGPPGPVYLIAVGTGRPAA